MNKVHLTDGVNVCFKGAWGGGLLMSRKHRHKLNGVERYGK